MNADGNFIWAIQFGGTTGEIGGSITTDGSGNVYVTGAFRGTVDFDPGAGIFNLSATGLDIFISKLDAEGNFVWAKQFVGSFNDMGRSITTDASGNVLTTGNFRGTADFDPGTAVFNLTAVAQEDIFICKLDASGNFIWAKHMGGSGLDDGNSITTDAAGNVYTTGQFAGTVDFDPGAGAFNLSSAGNQDIFISKLDADGNFVWVKQLGGTLFDNGLSITTDASGNIYTTGNFREIVDFDPGEGTFILTTNPLIGPEVFIIKLDANGDFVWAKQMGGPNSDSGYSIATDASGNVYTTGSFRETADFDPGTGIFNLTTFGEGDIFISKLDVNGNFVWAQQIGGTENKDIGYSINIDASANVYITGMFEGTADFDPGSTSFNLTSSGLTDIFVHKIKQSSAGIIENDFGENLMMFPNPTDGDLTLNLGSVYNAVTVILKNAVGQEIHKKNLHCSK